MFLFSLDYFGLLFLIVYVGAIVVLFLFIVMMLELKMVNISERFKDLFNYKNLFLSCLVVLILLLKEVDFYDALGDFYNFNLNSSVYFPEINLYLNTSKIVLEYDLLSVLGIFLFKRESVGILLAALLLFVSMVGSIFLTLDSKGVHSHYLKPQDINLQVNREALISITNYRI